MFVISWNICVWCSGHKKQKRNFSWRWFGRNVKLWGSAHGRVLSSGLHCAPGTSPVTASSSSLNRIERAFFLPIYNIIFFFSSFLPLLLIFSFLSLLRGVKTKQRGKFPVFLVLWWSFWGYQIINTPFLTWKIKSVGVPRAQLLSGIIYS